MNLFLQLWGGIFYLANKILLAFGEGEGDTRSRKVWGWACYLLGLPAWIVILVLERNWIAAALELGSVPSMLLGLFAAIQNVEQSESTWLSKIAGAFVYLLIPAGVGYSMYDFGGIVSINQVLEITAMVGFLGGTYLLAKQQRRGWLLFMLMNGSVAVLMLIQNNLILSIQQILSLGFVVVGYVRAGRR